jgi:ADP-ribosyl-[dinitrogen reductase] hydrolase
MHWIELKAEDKIMIQHQELNSGRKDKGFISRAQGCLLGQLAGDALGSLVEFQSPEEIKFLYPNGIHELADGGTWNTIAGQPTDDSEMALMLARMLIRVGKYDPNEAQKAYLYWLQSKPFDCGSTISKGLKGYPNHESQANGALMRISPLGIFGANYALEEVAKWARQDAAITHPHSVCQQTNALYTMAISQAIRSGCGNQELYEQIESRSIKMKVDVRLLDTVHGAALSPPEDYISQQGWVLIAFHNALWQLLHAQNLEQGVVDTVMRGGDTETNAAICGALLGAVHGRDAIPDQWVKTLLNCRPAAGIPQILRPRPECFWPVDVLELAEKLTLFRE